MSLSAIMELPGFTYLTKEGSLSIRCVYIPVHSELIHVFHIVYDQEFFCKFYFMYAQESQFIFQVCEKFYELTNIRHNITSTYHPQANGEVERFNRTTQDAFLKTQEFHDRLAQENTGLKSCRASCLHTESTNRHLPTSVPSI